jgi:DNA repair protein RadC
MKIKDLPLLDQPRQKLVRYGPERLSNPELLAVVIGSGLPGINAVQLASRVLQFSRERSLEKLTAEGIRSQFSLGTSKVAAVIACFELGRRLFNGKVSRLVLSPKDVWAQLQDIRDQRREHFIVFYLDVRNQIIKRAIISIGTLNASLVHPREVFEPAVKDSAAQIVLSHNHPSGIASPSEEDIQLTKRLISAGKILGIEVIDHIVVTKSTHFSFREHTLI